MELPVAAASGPELASLLLRGAERATIIDSPAAFVGVKHFEPGEVFANHFHEGYDEFFATLEGSITIWQGRSVRTELAAGGSLLCRRGTHHYLINESVRPAKLLFTKIPLVADDTVFVDWAPEANR